MYIKKLTQSLTLTLSLSLLLILVGKVFADTQSISDIPYNVIRITDGSSKDYQPEFSPDGKQIVFIKEISNSEGIKSGEFWHKTPYYMNLWLMDSDGKNRRQLTSGEVQDFAPMFTTDGKSIIFVSNRKHGNRLDIWSINVIWCLVPEFTTFYAFTITYFFNKYNLLPIRTELRLIIFGTPISNSNDIIRDI